MSSPRISIFARWPEPGLAKTRLIPALGADAAARIYARLLNRTIDKVRASGFDFELRVTGGKPEQFQQRFGGDLNVVLQGEGDLGARMARVATPVLIIGSDCPGLGAPILSAAMHSFEDRPVVLGPASDGGYYLIGLREPMPFLFEDMPWSTPSVFAETVARLAKRGIGPAVLPELSDIDVPEDLAAWPEYQ